MNLWLVAHRCSFPSENVRYCTTKRIETRRDQSCRWSLFCYGDVRTLVVTGEHWFISRACSFARIGRAVDRHACGIAVLLLIAVVSAKMEGGAAQRAAIVRNLSGARDLRLLSHGRDMDTKVEKRKILVVERGNALCGIYKASRASRAIYGAAHGVWGRGLGTEGRCKVIIVRARWDSADEARGLERSKRTVGRMVGMHENHT